MNRSVSGLREKFGLGRQWGWIGRGSRVSLRGERRSDFRGMDAFKGGRVKERGRGVAGRWEGKGVRGTVAAKG